MPPVFDSIDGRDSVGVVISFVIVVVDFVFASISTFIVGTSFALASVMGFAVLPLVFISLMDPARIRRPLSFWLL